MRIPGSTNPLEIVESTKLVGVTLTSNLKFHAHVNNIVKQAYNKIWMLRRLKAFGVHEIDLIEIYKIQIRSKLEYSVPAWNSSLTNEDINEIERVQKTAMKIIFGENYTDYESSLEINQLNTLEDRRRELCLKFAQKCTQNENHKALFKLNQNQTLHHPVKYEIPFCRHSPIPYLIYILNQEEL